MTTSPADQVDLVGALANADTLAAAGSHREAIAALTPTARATHHAQALQRLVQLRHQGFAADHGPQPAFEPPRAEPPPEPGRLPVITPDQLTLAELRSGLARHGCVHVRGLLAPAEVRELAAGIDRSLDAFDAADAAGLDQAPDDEAGWFSQFTPNGGTYRVGGRRRWVRASGAMWTVDSPEMFDRLVQLIDRTGIGPLVTEYFGERPALSANKCTMRRVPLDTNVGWHQDGAFLGAEVRALNLWIALGDCGTTAPGMDVVPRRFDHLAPSGTEGAMFEWSVAPEVVRSEAGDAGIIRPEFRAGDALLFDHLFLHSTAVEPTMTHERHALETWMFAPSAYPEGQIPLLY